MWFFYYKSDHKKENDTNILFQDTTTSSYNTKFDVQDLLHKYLNSSFVGKAESFQENQIAVQLETEYFVYINNEINSDDLKHNNYSIFQEIFIDQKNLYRSFNKIQTNIREIFKRVSRECDELKFINQNGPFQTVLRRFQQCKFQTYFDAIKKETSSLIAILKRNNV